MTNRARSPLEIGQTAKEGDVFGEVDVAGTTYRIQRSRANQREVIRVSDGLRVGTLRGSPSSMWRLEAKGIEDSLLRAIVSAAIADGLMADLPTD